jgi:hypothetical protein
MDYNNYPTAQVCEGGLAKAIQMPTLQQRLDNAVANCESRLKDAIEARDILKRNPDLEKLLNIMQKGNF